jgi:hypothetical protein
VYAATASHASFQANQPNLLRRFRPGGIYPPLATLDPPVSKREGDSGRFIPAPRLTYSGSLDAKNNVPELT